MGRFLRGILYLRPIQLFACILYCGLDGVATVSGDVDRNNHVISAEVSEWSPSDDVTPGSQSHGHGGKYTSTVHPIDPDTTQFVLDIHDLYR